MTFIRSPSWDAQLLNKDMIIHILIQNPKHLLHIVCVSVRLMSACLHVTLSPGDPVTWKLPQGFRKSRNCYSSWGWQSQLPRRQRQEADKFEASLSYIEQTLTGS